MNPGREVEKHSELIRRNEADGLRVIFLPEFSQLNLFFSFEQKRLFSCGDGLPGTVSWRLAKSVLWGTKPSLCLTSLLRNFSNITENDTRGIQTAMRSLLHPKRLLLAS